MRILFMGTPEIAATCLQALIDSEHTVIGVVCRRDMPKGRGMTLTPPPTKALAVRYGIPVYQPSTMRDGSFDETIRTLAPDITVVVAYGMILPSSVLRAPKYGSVNVHVSLLPRYRGAAPMQRAIMEGERETGVTLMQMDEGLDTGDILMLSAVPILPTDDFGTVHDRSAALGASMLLDLLPRIERGEVTPIPQDNAKATYAAKIEKSECDLDFTLSAASLDRIIRGLSPIPLAFTRLPNGKMCKVVRARIGRGSGTPGTILSLSVDGDGAITVACGEGALDIVALRPEGKGTMTASAYLRGTHLRAGEMLSHG